MDCLLLGENQESVEQLCDALERGGDTCRVVTTWKEMVSTLEQSRPDLLLIERSVLARLEPNRTLRLAEPDRWPTLILFDPPITGVDAAHIARRVSQTTQGRMRIGDLLIDTRKKRAGLHGRWVTLPPLQYRLLLALARRTGEVVSHRDLIKAVWGYDEDERETRALLKVHIRQIRRRLRLDPETAPYIRSVRGFGYMLAPPEESSREQ